MRFLFPPPSRGRSGGDCLENRGQLINPPRTPPFQEGEIYFNITYHLIVGALPRVRPNRHQAVWIVSCIELCSDPTRPPLTQGSSVYRQLVTPSVVAMAVRIEITT